MQIVAFSMFIEVFSLHFTGTISAEVAREVVVLLRGLRDDSPPWMAMIDGIYASAMLFLFCS